MPLMHLAQMILIQSTVLILAIFLLRFLWGKKFPPTARYTAWFALLLRLLIPVDIKSPVSIYNVIPPLSKLAAKPFKSPHLKFVSDISNTINLSLQQTQMHGTSSSDTALNVVPLAQTHPAFNFGQWLFILWLAGVLCFAVYYLAAGIKLRNVIKGSNACADPDLLMAYREVCRDLKLKRVPRLVVQDNISVPALSGILRPVVLFPSGLVNALNDHASRGIFFHELTHYRYRDHIVNALALLLRVVYWFDPLIWLALRSMRHDGELCCDYRVLSGMDAGERLAYGETLIGVVTNSPRLINAHAVGLAERSGIRRRIVGIRDYKRSSSFVSALSFSLIFLLAAAAFTGAAGAAAPLQTALQHTKAAVLVEEKNTLLSTICSVSAKDAKDSLTVHPANGGDEVLDLEIGGSHIIEDTGLQGEIADAEYPDLTGDGASEIVLVIETQSKSGPSRQMLIYTYDNGTLTKLPDLLKVGGFNFSSPNDTVPDYIVSRLDSQKGISLSDFLFGYVMPLSKAPFRLNYQKVNGYYSTEINFYPSDSGYYEKLKSLTTWNV